jgi:hypothetical protein
MRYVIFNIIILSFLSCSVITNYEIENVYNKKSKNTIDAIIEKLNDNKLISISETHAGINEELFIIDNISLLHDAGVRYLFFEGGPSLDSFNDEYIWFPIFYPWIEAGWKYENIRLIDTISCFNYGLSDEDKIKIVYPELNSSRDVEATIESNMNYRDFIAAKNIIDIMDTTKDNIKGIVCYGEAHGSLKIKKNWKSNDENVQYDWVPLGYRLKEHYNEYFSSYILISGNDYIRNKVTKWDDIVSASRFISSNEVNKNFISYIIGTTSIFNGYIFEPNEIYGTYYQYHPDKYILKYLFNVVYNYSINEPTVEILVNGLDYKSQFIKSLYYLKLYFGDIFEYEYWGTKHSTDLQFALASLKEYIYNDDLLLKYVNFDYDKLNMHSYYMAISNLDYNIKHNNFESIIYSLSKAYDIFPSDIWSLYWLGYAESELKHYSEALFYFQLLFDSGLSSFIETLPLVYRKAAFCANKINDYELEKKYLNISESLYNEFSIAIENYDMDYIIDK